MRFEEICQLPDGELLAVMDMREVTAEQLREEIREMDSAELLYEYDLEAGETIEQLRAELLALDDQQLRALHDVQTPAEIRAELANWRCHDCKVWTDYEYYMVEHHLWQQAAEGTHEDAMLCIGCFEHRLGRSLKPLDFLDAPINASSAANQRTVRLNERMGHDITQSVDYTS